MIFPFDLSHFFDSVLFGAWSLVTRTQRKCGVVCRPNLKTALWYRMSSRSRKTGKAQGDTHDKSIKVSFLHIGTINIFSTSLLMQKLWHMNWFYQSLVLQWPLVATKKQSVQQHYSEWLTVLSLYKAHHSALCMSGYKSTPEYSRFVSDMFLYRMKEMSNMMEKQHDLLKLIIQKMEITSEADEHDGPVNVRGSMWPGLSRNKPRVHSTSRWVPLMKAIEAKKTCGAQTK